MDPVWLRHLPYDDFANQFGCCSDANQTYWSRTKSQTLPGSLHRICDRIVSTYSRLKRPWSSEKKLNIIVKGCFHKHTDCLCKDHDMPMYRPCLLAPLSYLIFHKASGAFWNNDIFHRNRVQFMNAAPGELDAWLGCLESAQDSHFLPLFWYGTLMRLWWSNGVEMWKRILRIAPLEGFQILYWQVEVIAVSATATSLSSGLPSKIRLLSFKIECKDFGGDDSIGDWGVSPAEPTG